MKKQFLPHIYIYAKVKTRKVKKKEKKERSQPTNQSKQTDRQTNKNYFLMGQYKHAGKLLQGIPFLMQQTVILQTIINRENNEIT